MIVQFVNRQSKYPVQSWKILLCSVLSAAWDTSALGIKLAKQNTEATLTVIFAGPRQMRQINCETRMVDRLTDVLSFPLLDMAEGKLNQPLGAQDYELDKSGRQILPIGDIIISLDKAQSQAEEYGHSMEREEAFLAVHGFLHLMGFDHETIPQEKKMLQKQRQILDSLGLSRE